MSKLISVEGLDGAGKSTVITALTNQLRDVLAVREPGGTALSELVRTVLKGEALSPDSVVVGAAAQRLLLNLRSSTKNLQLRDLAEKILVQATPGVDRITGELSAEDELLLFNIARAQLMEEIILPALRRDQTVILDRFIDSTIAYQGYGRGLDPDHVKQSCLLATTGLEPDLTIYLRISPRTRLDRIGNRGDADRIEASGDAFFENVARGFDILAQAQRFVIVNGEQSPEQVAAEALEALSS